MSHPADASAVAQAYHRAQAARLLREAGGKLEVTAAGLVRVSDPELAAEMRPLKAELGELLRGVRCVECGQPLAGEGSVRAGVAYAHRRCAWSNPRSRYG